MRQRQAHRAATAVLLMVVLTGCPSAAPTPEVVLPPNPAAEWLSKVRTTLIVYDATLAAVGDAYRGELITKEQYDAVLEAGKVVQIAGNTALALISAYLSLPDPGVLAEIEAEYNRAESGLTATRLKWEEARGGSNN